MEEVNILRDDKLIDKVEEYLSNDSLNVIILASQKLLAQAVEDEKFRERLLLADGVADYHSIEMLLRAVSDEEKSMYVVLENPGHRQHIERFLNHFRSGIVLVGGAVESEEEDEGIVNEINSLAPDILLLDLEDEKQETWILSHTSQLNAKLCICAGSVIDQMILEYRKEPALISKLHLTKLYHALLEKKESRQAKKEES
jgi:UDP-N-acetyl-D-mannosaminuronic acid transferase (WecB/TagA/CpsF family)